MRKERFVENEYYHIFNRGNNKQLIFKDEKDWARLLFLILYLQSPTTILNVGRQINYFIKHGLFNILRNTEEEIIKNRYIELIVFELMPNHFHLIVRELEKGGISNYMKRILGGYTKYFNTKNKISGHLFQGPFRAVHIEDNPQILYLSAYIHNNIRELKEWKGKEELFPYSSFQDYIKENRWGELLRTDIIKNQFHSTEKYKLFVKESGAKEDKV